MDENSQLIVILDKVNDLKKAIDSFVQKVERSISDIDMNIFRCCGEYFDMKTGAAYLKARYYQASIGRFTQRDTVTGKFSGPLSLSLHTYAHNNPVFYFDLSKYKVVGMVTKNMNKFEEVKDVLGTGMKLLIEDMAVNNRNMSFFQTWQCYITEFHKPLF